MSSVIDDEVRTDGAPPKKPTRRQRQAAAIADAASGSMRMLLIKIVLLGLVDAIALYALFVLVGAGQWVVAVIVAAVAALVNWIYFSRRRLPAKYLTPGVIFLVVFQVFVLFYTGYVAFTNYGTGHNGSKEQAVSSLMASSLQRVEDSPTYPVMVVDRGGELGLLVTDPGSGDAFVGTNDEPPLTEVEASFDGDRASRPTDGPRCSSPMCSPAPTRSPSSRCPTPTTRTTARSARPTGRARTATSRRSSTTRMPAR